MTQGAQACVIALRLGRDPTLSEAFGREVLWRRRDQSHQWALISTGFAISAYLYLEVSMTLAQGGEGDKQRWALISTATVRIFEISNPRTLAELCGGPQGTLSVGSSIDTLECRSVQNCRPGPASVSLGPADRRQKRRA